MSLKRARSAGGILVWLLVSASSASVAGVDVSSILAHEGKKIVNITFTGNNTTRDFFIAREIELAVGDSLSLAELVEGVTNLENYGIFGSIDVAAKDEGDGVSLEYQFREMPPIIPYLALNYTEENGFSIGPAVAALNFLGRAIRVSGQTLFGGTTSFALMVGYPWITRDYHLGIDVVAAHLVRDDELNGFEETSDEVTPWIKRYIGENGRIRGMIGYFHMKADRDGITLSPDRSDHFFRAGAAVGYDSRDSWRIPHDGWENEIEVVGSIGDGDYVSTTVDFRRFQPVTGTQTLFMGVLASFQPGTVGKNVPSYAQYHVGGANSVRGQDFNLGKSLFGTNQLITTVEYQVGVLPLKPYNFFKWSAAIGVQLAFFSDTGIAWSNSDEFSSERTKSGFGTGLRLLIPGVDMVRFDFGFNRQGDAYFHFGGMFKWSAQRLRLR